METGKIGGIPAFEHATEVPDKYVEGSYLP